MKPTEVSSKDIMDWTKEKMQKHHLPTPLKPEYTDPKLDFPDDPDDLSSNKLGQLMLQMTAFLGWALSLYGLADSEFALVDSEYKVQVNSLGIEKRKELGRLSADVIEAAVLADNEDLGELYERRLKLQTVRIQLDNRIKIYEKFYAALSRELSRRELEAKTS